MDEHPQTRAGPVTLREIAAEFGDEFLSWDRGLPGTFFALFVRPARVVRAYLDERSRRYTRPLRYLLLSVALGLLANWWAYDHGDAERLLSPQEQQLRQSAFLIEHAALMTLLILPLVAVGMRLAFAGLGLRYVDALVLLGYTQAQVNLVSLVIPLWHATVGSRVLDVPVVIAVIGYLIWAWASTARGRAWRRWLSAVIAFVLAQAINAGVVSLVVFLARKLS